MIESLQERNTACRDWIDMITQASPAAATVAATVLVVEDDFLVRLCAADALSEAGFNVLQADSGPDALRILEDGPVDVVFTDINMPGAFDGAGWRGGSAAPLARDRRRGHVGARLPGRWPRRRPFLPKPYMPDSLARLIEEVLGHHAGHHAAGKVRCLAR
jgi:two-component system, response regulator PdtaR